MHPIQPNPATNTSVLKKLLFCSFFIALFCKMLATPWDIAHWQQKYELFGVPAFPYPGGDARNIQGSAYCHEKGSAYFENGPCLENAPDIKAVHPSVSIPPLNYPSIWARAYGYFHNATEAFFINFWFFNTALTIAGLLAVSLRFNHALFPLLLFSPTVLLTIERGNIDGSTFFATFLPLVIFQSKRLQGFFLGLATALKIFPMFAYLAFFKRDKPFFSKQIFIGALFGAPFALFSLFEIKHLAQGTTQGFAASYGLMSLQYTSHLAQKASLAYALIGGYTLIAVSIIFGLSRQKNLMQDVDLQIGSWSEVSKTLLAVSFCIYLCTFLVFTNWAYRLIFLAPALLVLSPKEVAQKTSLVGKMAYWNIFAALWIPILPYGWALQNLVCYVLVVPTAVLTARIFRTWTTHKTKNAEASVDELPVEVKPLPPVSSYQTRSTSAVI